MGEYILLKWLTVYFSRPRSSSSSPFFLDKERSDNWPRMNEDDNDDVVKEIEKSSSSSHMSPDTSH